MHKSPQATAGFCVCGGKIYIYAISAGMRIPGGYEIRPYSNRMVVRRGRRPRRPGGSPRGVLPTVWGDVAQRQRDPAA